MPLCGMALSVEPCREAVSEMGLYNTEICLLLCWGRGLSCRGSTFRVGEYVGPRHDIIQELWIEIRY